jgi:ABC-type multidrug transport system fused ATPase/permease subunit
MIHGLIRSPSSYFDITPTGRLNNKFSNDLGLLDNMLSFIMTDSIEGAVSSIVLLLNVLSINIYFIFPGIVNIIFIILYFKYCKNAIIITKQLELRLKNPVFNMVG